MPEAITIREATVRWSTGFFFSSAGTLVLTRDRLTLLAKGETKFSLYKSEWGNVTPYGLGAALKVKVDGRSYTISFVPLWPNYAQRADAIDEASQWRILLAGGTSIAEPRGFGLLFRIIATIAGVALGIAFAAATGRPEIQIFWATIAVLCAASVMLVFRAARR